MKQTRRKELKTNELSVYLQQIYEAAVRNATYLVGGVVVVVIVLVVALLTQRNRSLEAHVCIWISQRTDERTNRHLILTVGALKRP